MNNENTSLASYKLISLGPESYVEKYDAGFEFPRLNEKGKEKLNSEIENGKITLPIKEKAGTKCQL